MLEVDWRHEVDIGKQYVEHRQKYMKRLPKINIWAMDVSRVHIAKNGRQLAL